MPIITIRDKSIDYFGELTWANHLDWLVTLCLGAIIALTALQLGGVRPETQLMVQPLFIVLMVLHGIFLATTSAEARRLSLIPFLFLPFLLWAVVSMLFFSPTPWRGSYELSYFFSAFLIGWVAVNNVRTRAHLWALIIIAILPLGKAIFIGYYQFFQDPDRLAGVALEYPIVLSSEYRGQATGIFADPGSFAAFLLMLLPCFTIAAFVPRLPKILRVLSIYVAAILVVAITLTQTYWASLSVVALLAIVPWFAFDKKPKRYLFSFLGVSAAMAVLVLMYLFNPLFERGLARAITPEGEGIRLVLWEEATRNFLEQPLFGSGAGSFSYMAEKSSDLALARIPHTPHNDFLLILGSYGLIGACLLFGPLVYVFIRSLRQWAKEPYKIKTVQGFTMSSQKFFLSVAICSGFAILLCASLHFLVYVPALLLYCVFMLSILVKASFRRSVPLPGFRFSGLCYIILFSLVGLLFWAKVAPLTQSKGLELQATQQLETLVERGVGVSGNLKLIDEVIEIYGDALIADPDNADAWIGLSMTICQLHYRNPADFERTGARAVAAAKRALEISPDYWRAAAQYGVAQALSGEVEAARYALARAVELAPNSSNAHYYYAAFLSGEPSKREEATELVRRALEIDPNNAVARRLEQKLLIL